LARKRIDIARWRRDTEVDSEIYEVLSIANDGVLRRKKGSWEVWIHQAKEEEFLVAWRVDTSHRHRYDKMLPYKHQGSKQPLTVTSHSPPNFSLHLQLIASASSLTEFLS